MSDWDADAVKGLRGAVYRGDPSIVDLVRGRLTDDVLQLAGDGLLDAVTHEVSGAAELATRCAAALTERGWDGDGELADQLNAAAGRSATPLLRPVGVDLEELASLLEGDSFGRGGRVDLKTGECWPDSLDYQDDEVDDDIDQNDRWLYVECVGSHDGYQDMELFIATLDKPEIADRLQIAISGKGAFGRFKDVLSRRPEELDRYYLLSNERQRGRARAWLAAEGYRPARAARL
jgi:Uncharacterised protein family (UPF0158)